MVTRDTSKYERRDRGVAQVLITRLETRRLPYALKLKERVNRGERLTDFDTRLLKKVYEESGEVRRLVKKLPQYEGLVAQMTELYDEITRKALENEHKPLPSLGPSDDDL